MMMEMICGCNYVTINTNIMIFYEGLYVRSPQMVVGLLFSEMLEVGGQMSYVDHFKIIIYVFNHMFK